MQSTEPNHIDRKIHSGLAALSLVIGAGMTLAILLGMVGGKVHNWKAGVGMLIMLSIPICTLGTALAIVSLIWRKENKKLAQAGLWLNGLLAFFGFPLMIYWLLAIM